MQSLKLLIVLVIGMVVLASASPTLSRHARSPKGGHVDLSYNQNKSGREASVQYKQNLYKSKDGRATIDAYGQASRHFDQNRNDYSAGVKGSINF